LYAEKILEQIRRQAEFTDSLQSFLLLHSLGGGTGSGLGTYILPLLEDHYPDVYRFTSAVFPSEDDDVITSPYNSVLSLGQLIEHSDCVLPIDNQSLMDITNRIHVKSSKSLTSETQGKPFDGMNNIAAHLLLNLTCSMRFGGALNVDLNGIISK
jgi:tubulin epsilon